MLLKGNEAKMLCAKQLIFYSLQYTYIKKKFTYDSEQTASFTEIFMSNSPRDLECKMLKPVFLVINFCRGQSLHYFHSSKINLMAITVYLVPFTGHCFILVEGN